MKTIHKLTSFCTALLTAAGMLLMPVTAADAEPRPVRTQNDCLAKFPLMQLENIPNHIRGTGASGRRSAAPMTDSEEAYVPLLMISVGFQDLPYDDAYDISTQYFSGEKSITSYYHDQSFGKFTYLPAAETSAYQTGGNTNRFDRENDGVVHVTLKRKRSDWSQFPAQGTTDEDVRSAYWQEYDTTMREAFTEALEQADAYVNFASFDKNCNGAIETSELAICFAVSGWEASAVSSWEQDTLDATQYFWSIAYSFEEINEELDEPDTLLPSLDHTFVNSFIAVPEFEWGDEHSGTETVCHELGHYLGLPDLYDTDYVDEDMPWYNYEVRLLSIMAAGNYQYEPDTDVYLPASFDIWSKWILGWTEPQPALASGVYEITAEDYDHLSKGCKSLLISTENELEFYLIENRQLTKWDRGLSYTALRPFRDLDPKEWGQEGLILWHIDMSEYENYIDENRINSLTHRPFVIPLYGERTDDEGTVLTDFGQCPVTRTGFYSKTIWEKRYSQTIGDRLDLPVYGVDDPDDRSARTHSGITVQFLDDNADSMRILLDYGDGMTEQLGDVNRDYEVDILDVIVLNKFLLGLQEVSPEAQKNADINEDQTVDSTDALELLKLVLGVEKPLSA